MTVSIARQRTPCRCFTSRKREQAIGTTVSDTNIEINIAAAMVIANSRNSLPVLPLMSESGASTATTDSVVAMTGKPTSSAPFHAASMGVSPSSWRR